MKVREVIKLTVNECCAFKDAGLGGAIGRLITFPSVVTSSILSEVGDFLKVRAKPQEHLPSDGKQNRELMWGIRCCMHINILLFMLIKQAKIL